MTRWELREALFSRGGLGSHEGGPGLDGLLFFFYSAFWEIVQAMAIMEELSQGHCGMKWVKKCYVVCTGDFRPILLSNSICLIILKVPANWLWVVIG